VKIIFVAQQDEEKIMNDVQHVPVLNVQNSILFSTSFPKKAQSEFVEADLSVKKSDNEKTAVSQQVQPIEQSLVAESESHTEQCTVSDNALSVLKTSPEDEPSIYILPSHIDFF